jgi:hypothetical protein
MKLKTLFFTLTLVGIAVVFMAGAIQAGTQVDDVIKMQNPAYSEHTKGIVEFTHKKHAAEYGAKCGDCHHDDKGQPLADLKEVRRCARLHRVPQDPRRGAQRRKEGMESKEAQKRRDQQAGPRIPCRSPARQLHRLPQDLEQGKQIQGRTDILHQVPPQDQISRAHAA